MMIWTTSLSEIVIYRRPGFFASGFFLSKESFRALWMGWKPPGQHWGAFKNSMVEAPTMTHYFEGEIMHIFFPNMFKTRDIAFTKAISRLQTHPSLTWNVNTSSIIRTSEWRFLISEGLPSYQRSHTPFQLSELVSGQATDEVLMNSQKAGINNEKSSIIDHSLHHRSLPSFPTLLSEVHYLPRTHLFACSFIQGLLLLLLLLGSALIFDRAVSLTAVGGMERARTKAGGQRKTWKIIEAYSFDSCT